MVARNAPPLIDLRHHLGLATERQRHVSSVEFARSHSDPEGYAASIDELHRRWRDEDLPEMEWAAGALMVQFIKSEDPGDWQWWREIETDILDCRVALGDVEYHAHERRTAVKDAMRSRAKRVGLRIPKARRIDRTRPTVYAAG